MRAAIDAERDRGRRENATAVAQAELAKAQQRMGLHAV